MTQDTNMGNAENTQTPSQDMGGQGMAAESTPMTEPSMEQPEPTTQPEVQSMPTEEVQQPSQETGGSLLDKIKGLFGGK